MENKGQVSAEYLLLLVVILIIMAAVTIPLVAKSVNATMDVSTSSDTKNAVQSIANAVNLVYANGPGAKRTISIYMPQTMNLTYDSGSNTINQMLVLSSQNKPINASVDYAVNFTNPTPSKGWHQAQVEWPLNGNSNSPIIVAFS
ncbi:class III signal peptide-containing protein [uncultured Methanobacterium sp.]|uniref:class III signal peptide-containing protein n=1 Tax=uncultured Methanobacterium sp. TaxID=176306 RepID=UPI002AA60557|nr:class III signal peptide-containing protein [uncultured Methanobacterium sp.]